MKVIRRDYIWGIYAPHWLYTPEPADWFIPYESKEVKPMENLISTCIYPTIRFNFNLENLNEPTRPQ